MKVKYQLIMWSLCLRVCQDGWPAWWRERRGRGTGMGDLSVILDNTSSAESCMHHSLRGKQFPCLSYFLQTHLYGGHSPRPLLARRKKKSNQKLFDNEVNILYQGQIRPSHLQVVEITLLERVCGGKRGRRRMQEVQYIRDQKSSISCYTHFHCASSYPSILTRLLCLHALYEA